MNKNRKMTLKLLALVAALFFNLSLALAQPGIVDIVWGAKKQQTENVLISVDLEQHKTFSIVFIHETGKRFVKKIYLTSQFARLRLNLPKGKYRILVTDIETGSIQKYTTLFQ